MRPVRVMEEKRMERDKEKKGEEVQTQHDITEQKGMVNHSERLPHTETSS